MRDSIVRKRRKKRKNEWNQKRKKEPSFLILCNNLILDRKSQEKSELDIQKREDKVTWDVVRNIVAAS